MDSRNDLYFGISCTFTRGDIFIMYPICLIILWNSDLNVSSPDLKSSPSTLAILILGNSLVWVFCNKFKVARINQKSILLFNVFNKFRIRDSSAASEFDRFNLSIPDHPFDSFLGNTHHLSNLLSRIILLNLVFGLLYV